MQNDNWYLNLIHLHYIKKADFERDLNTRNISKKSIAFIDEGRMIWTHGKYYQCDDANWSKVISFIDSLNFQQVVNDDGSITYTLCGKNASGYDYATDASFTIQKDIFIESAKLIDDGKTLKVVLNNGQVIYIDLTKLFQLLDFVSTDSILFVLSPDPLDPDKNTIIKAYARQLLSATNPNVKIVAGDTGVLISTDQAYVSIEGDSVSIVNDETSVTIGEDSVSISTGDSSVSVGDNSIFVESGTVNLESTNGDVNITASEGNSVKINSPLYLSENQPDVEAKLEDLQNQIDEIIAGGGGGGGSYIAGNGIDITDHTISIKTNDYFETTNVYWDI